MDRRPGSDAATSGQSTSVGKPKQATTPPPQKSKAVAVPSTAETEDQQRLQGIINALAKMGVTVEDLMNGGMKVVAHKEAFNRATLTVRGMDEKRLAVAMDVAGGSMSLMEIAKKHGITKAKVEAIRDEASTNVRAELEARVAMAKKANEESH